MANLPQRCPSGRVGEGGGRWVGGSYPPHDDQRQVIAEGALLTFYASTAKGGRGSTAASRFADLHVRLLSFDLYREAADIWETLYRPVAGALDRPVRSSLIREDCYRTRDPQRA